MKLRYVVASGLIVPMLILGPVALAEDSNSSSDTSTTSAETKKDSTTLQQRIEKHKTELKTKLTSLEETRLKARCKAGQGIVKIARERADGVTPNRVKAYQELQEHLTKIIAKLKALGIDTSALEQEQAVLATKAAKIKSDFETYKQNLSDLKDVDCVSDPTGFKAALETARTTHDSLVKELADIKAYIINTIKPTLADMRTQVQAKTSSEGNQ